MSVENEHFFVHVDPNDPDANIVGGMDSDAGEENPSITKFLTLPTTFARVSNKKQDVEFTKSIMLTSDTYIHAAEQLKLRYEEASKEK